MTMTFGWAVHVSYSGIDENGKGVFAANLVMPGAVVDSRPPVPAPDDKRWTCTDKDDPETIFGDLLFPWRWKIGQWRVFQRAQGSADAWTKVDDCMWELAARVYNDKAFRGSLETWMKLVSRGLTDPFAVETQRTADTRQSIPHALAPLTHLPAALSGETLQMAGHLRLAVTKDNEYVAFPSELSVEVAGTTYKFTCSGTPQTASAQPWLAYTSDPTPFKAGTDDCDLVLVANAARMDGGTVASGPIVVADAHLRPIELRQLVAEDLHPVRILADFSDEDHAKRTSKDLLDLAVNALGAGAVGAPRVVGGAPMRFPSLLLSRVTAERLGWDDSLLSETLARNRANDLLVRFAQELARYSRNDGTGPVLDALNAFLTDKTPAALAALMANMVTAQQDPQTRVWQAWFLTLAAIIFETTNPQLRDELLARLVPTALDRGGFGRTAWVHRLSAISGLWTAVDNQPVLEQKPGAALDLIAVTLDINGLPVEAKARTRGHDDVVARSGGTSGIKLLRDPGLQLQFEPSTTMPDQDFRGYAVALQVSLDGTSGVAAEWITQTGIEFDGTWVDASAGTHAFVAETIGSTFAQGFRLVAAEYAGAPLLGSLEQGTDGDAGFLHNRWPTEFKRDVPLLAYGASYRGIEVALDNAGGELGDAAMLGNTSLGAGASDAAARCDAMHPAFVPYRSRVECAAPTIDAWDTAKAVPTLIDPRYFELADESRVHAWWNDQHPGERPPPVLTLTPENAKEYEVDLSHLDLALTPPVADASFIERWLNTDILAVGKQAGDVTFKKWFSYPEFFGANRTQLEDLCAKLRGRTLGDRATSFNPAVKKLRVRVFYDGSANPAEDFAIDTPIVDGSGAGIKLRDAPAVSWRIGIKSDASNAADAKVIRVGKGSYARVVVSALVESAFFEAGEQWRFETHIGTPVTVNKQQYHDFGVSELWIEALPDFKSPVLTDDLLQLEHPAPQVEPTSRAVVLDRTLLSTGAIPDATFLKGLALERHEWHWTGYDAPFPPDPQSQPMAQLVATLVSVSSYRETIVRDLVTKPTAKGQAADPQKLYEHRLPIERGAGLVAYTARPILRYRKWLKSSIVAAEEKTVIAIGRVIKGAAYLAPEDRVPTPAWAWTLPLCQTYQADGDKGGVARLANGNLLVFDEPIRRTDVLVRLGGIGEVIDVDVTGTRVADSEEQGVNPIFHELDDGVHKAMRIRATNPFGLTYDQGSNPKVAQTAIVVYPENSAGKWVMCKMRSRRYYLPELMNVEAAPLASAGLAPLGTRLAKDKRVPIDFCIDVSDSCNPTAVSILTEAGDLLGVLKTPSLTPMKAKQRLLVTWHFDRFDTAKSDPVWRPQVILQQGRANMLGWDNVHPFSVPQLQSNFDLGLEHRQVRLKVEFSAGKAEWMPVLVSDYTDPQWLLFVGSFGRVLKASHEYRLTKKGSGDLQLQRLEGKRWIDETTLTLAKPSDATACFQLGMVYRPANDVMRGLPDVSAGAIKGWLQPKAPGAFEGFGGASSAEPGDYIYLLTFQRTTAEAAEVNKPVKWDDVRSRMFPATEESTIRLVPEYLGPIAVV